MLHTSDTSQHLTLPQTRWHGKPCVFGLYLFLFFHKIVCTHHTMINRFIMQKFLMSNLFVSMNHA
uniref:Uncharacterized protein n=1 Tax=Rhizophora mucronata TaxID=61149 RepID=A0A2P2JKG3_RHIMU